MQLIKLTLVAIALSVTLAGLNTNQLPAVLAVDPMPDCFPCGPPSDNACDIMPECCPQGCID